MSRASEELDVAKCFWATANRGMRRLCIDEDTSDKVCILAPEDYINVPLERTYTAAWEGVPERWRRVIESKL